MRTYIQVNCIIVNAVSIYSFIYMLEIKSWNASKTEAQSDISLQKDL